MNPAYLAAFWVFVVLGAFIFVMNWAMLLVSIWKHTFHSVVPLFGGLFLGAAIYIYPCEKSGWLCLLPLVFDIGSVPMVVLVMRASARRRKLGEDSS